MAGYVYRGSRVRKMRGEEFDRKHGVVPDVQEKPRAKAPQKRATTPMTKTPQRPAADFEIVREDPPQGVASVNGVAARAAAKALHAAPGQWHRVARVADAAAAKSYIGTLRNHVQRVSTRTVRDASGRRAVYAMSRPVEGEE